MSLCPVCQAEYTKSEVNLCFVCNWDLTPCPAAFLEKQNIQVVWAKEMWVKFQALEKQLHTKINTEIETNPQLSQLKEESNLEIWNLLINWVCGVDLEAAKMTVKNLQETYQGKEPRQIARILVVQKSFQAAGLELVKGIPSVNEILNGLAGVDLPIIAILSAEMIYQIAAIYGFDLQFPERKLEVLAAFGVAFLGEQAIDAGIDWLKYGISPGTLISAATKGLMIYAMGNTACLFYEAKLNQQINPLNSPEVFDKLKQESQAYLKDATSEDAIIDIISFEIKTNPIKIQPPKLVKTFKETPGPVKSTPNVSLKTNVGANYTRLRDLLAGGKWREADEETRRIMLWIARRKKEGWFRNQDILKFPCTDLRTIDQLWVQRSSGRFGFSVQRQIYEEVRENSYELERLIGWRSKYSDYDYDSLTFARSAQRGHLPAAIEKKNGKQEYVKRYRRIENVFRGGVNVGEQEEYGNWEFQKISIFDSLIQRLVDCNI